MGESLITMVYAPNNYSEKQELWDYLVHFKGSVSMPWCAIEDFNDFASLWSQSMYEILLLHESLSRLFKNMWIVRTTSVRKSLLGQGGVMLVELTEPSCPRHGFKRFPLLLCLVFPSIHRIPGPSWWKWIEQIGGPKPIKFLNCWWLQPDFKVVIQNLWSSTIISVSGSDRMAKVIKTIKEGLKVWNVSNSVSGLDRITRIGSFS